MNLLHLTTFRALVHLELIALDAIVTFFWINDCPTWQELLVQLRRTIQGNRLNNYWHACQKLFEPFNPAIYLLEGDNEFVFDFVAVRKLTLRSIQIVLDSHIILDDSTYYELTNLLDDILVGYRSATHQTGKLYPVRSKHRMVTMYSQEVV